MEKLLSVGNNNRINFHVQTNISSGSGSSMPVFCFNSGPVDESGEPALITLSENTLTLNAPAVCTTAGVETYAINDNISLDISELADGNYNLLYNPETEGLEITPDGKVGIGNQHTAGRGSNCQDAMYIPKGNKYRVWTNGGNLKYARFYFCETGEK